MTQRLRYPELAPEGVAALGNLEHHLNVASGLDAVLLELVRLRASLLNGCEYCIAIHSAELRRHNEPETRIAAVAAWLSSEAYTERERAGLRWAEVITDVQQGHVSDAEFTAVREHFNDAELVNLTLAIASINAWNRMAIAFRPQWRERAGGDSKAQASDTSPGAPAPGVDQSAVGDDGGKIAVDA